MKTSLKVSLALLVAAAPVGPMAAAMAQDPVPVTNPAPQQVKYSNQQLDNLVAAIALYPDAILAQVLIASTFPDQVDFAAKHLRVNGALDIEAQSWDVSVKAVAHYPPVLNMMADRPDWTTALGQAYAGQSVDVMQAVQRLRQMANAQGNLVSTAQQTVVNDGQDIKIEPTQPTVIYVPTYDPAVIYYEPVRIVGPYAGYWSFGYGFPIGGWLTYDCNWYGGVVFYDGWYGGGWRARSRPFVVINTVYARTRFQPVTIGHGIFSRSVNFSALGRVNGVHHDVTFENHARAGVFENRTAAPARGRDQGREPAREQGREPAREQTRQPVRSDAHESRVPMTFNRQSGQWTAPPAAPRSAPPARQAQTTRQAPPPAAREQRSAPPPSHSSQGSSHSSGGSSSHSSSSSKGSDKKH